MRIVPREPPREFGVGTTGIHLRDCGTIALDADEQVTFVTGSGGEVDVVRKAWGFYAAPSLNGRLVRFGMRAVLALGRDHKFFLLLVEQGHEAEFERYLEEQSMRIVQWLDTDASLERLARLADGR